MSDFTVEIYDTKNIIEIETSTRISDLTSIGIDTIETTNIVEIDTSLDQNDNQDVGSIDLNDITEIEVAISTNNQNDTAIIDIETSSASFVEISTGFSASITTPLVYASDVIGLTEFLTNFMDSFEIDCGTP